MNPTEKRRAGEAAFNLLLLAASGYVLFVAYRISGFSSVSSPGTFPMLAAGVMVGSMATVLWKERRRAIRADESRIGRQLRRAIGLVFPPVLLVYTGIIVGYMILIEPLHFIASSFAFLLVSIVYLKGARPLRALGISAVTLGSIYLVFHYLFRVTLP